VGDFFLFYFNLRPPNQSTPATYKPLFVLPIRLCQFENRAHTKPREKVCLECGLGQSPTRLGGRAAVAAQKEAMQCWKAGKKRNQDHVLDRILGSGNE